MESHEKHTEKQKQCVKDKKRFPETVAEKQKLGGKKKNLYPDRVMSGLLTLTVSRALLPLIYHDSRTLPLISADGTVPKQTKLPVSTVSWIIQRRPHYDSISIVLHYGNCDDFIQYVKLDLMQEEKGKCYSLIKDWATQVL